MKKNQKPLVSVIMGVYNSNPTYIDEAVKSILKQTLSSFELIICDDGSNLEIKKYLREIADKDNRIKIIENEINRGLAYTLNRCIQISTGKYIARMDDDDISLPNRFEEQVGFLKSHAEYMFVGSNIDYIDDNGETWGKRELPANPSVDDFFINSPFVHPSIMFRREIFSDGNYYLNKKITCRMEDYEFWMRCYYQKRYGANIQKVLLQYREGAMGMRKRKLKFRFHEVVIRALGYYELGILKKGIPFLIKPLFVAILPGWVIGYAHKNRGIFTR